MDTDVVIVLNAFLDSCQISRGWGSSSGKEKIEDGCKFIATLLARSYAAGKFPSGTFLRGCDTVWQFVGRGKLSCWKTWVLFPQATDTFIQLSTCAKPIKPDQLKII